MIISTERSKWIDIAKGIAITLMVVGHTSIPKVLSDFIWAFHMPLFFIVSGYCTNYTKYSTAQFIVRKIKTLIIPFVLYSAIVITISYFTELNLFSIQQGWQGYALWFVPVLFFSTILAYLIKHVERRGFQIIILCICAAIGYFLCYKSITLPYTLSTVPYATLLVYFGSLLKESKISIAKPQWYIIFGGVIITLVISHFWRLDLAWNHITPIIPLTIGAICGTIMIFNISSYIDLHIKKMGGILQTIGKETFAIMAFSQITILLLNKYTSLNSILRYAFLAFFIGVFIVVKNKIKTRYNRL